MSLKAVKKIAFPRRANLRRLQEVPNGKKNIINY